MNFITNSHLINIINKKYPEYFPCNIGFISGRWSLYLIYGSNIPEEVYLFVKAYEKFEQLILK
jgi:hypothetical protein